MKNFMKRLIPVILLLATTAVSHAQIQALRDETANAVIVKDPNDTTKQTWKTGGLYNLTFNQAALSNWAAGGDKSALSLSTLLKTYAFYKDGRRSWDNTLTLAYGITQATSLGTRKTDARIDLVSKYGSDLGSKW